MKIAIVGCGEVGRAYAAARAAAGYEVVLIDPSPGAAAIAMSDQLGVAIHISPAGIVGDVDRVWICVAGDAVLSVCDSLIGELPAGAVVVDLTTASPHDKRACEAILAAAEIDYADVVIMGSVGVTGARTALLGAGPHAALVGIDFSELGAPVRILQDSRTGDAATVKLLRTILTKGLETLAVECLIAAESQGLRRDLYDVLGDVDASGFVKFLEMLVTSHVQHAARRLHEVQRAQAQLVDMGCRSVVLPGSEDRFELTAKALERRGADLHDTGDIDAVVSWLTQTARPESTSA